jgi:hypothetical protein
MNTFTSTYIANKSAEDKQKYVDQDSACEHVEADVNVAQYVLKENDSFGTVGSHVVCAECKKKAEEEEDNETYVCVDCKETKPQKEGIQWKWYDFYAAQGDTPMFVCDCCRPKEKHQARVAADQRAYNEEFGDPEDEGDDIHQRGCQCKTCEPFLGRSGAWSR